MKRPLNVPPVDENRPTPRHIVVKFQNTGTKRRGYRLLKREKKVTYKASGVRMSSDCSTLMREARRERSDAFEIFQLEFFTKPNYH